MTVKSVNLKLTLWLTFIATFFQLAFQELTPEDIRFADNRCQNDTQNSTRSLKALWTQRIYPNDKATHCYIKCFLRKLGLINLNNRGLNLSHLLEILEMAEIETKPVCLEMLLQNQPLDGTCSSYYFPWVNFTKQCKDITNMIMNDEKIDFWKSNENLPRWKERNETATHFCDTEFSRIDANIAAEVSDVVGDDSFVSSYKCNLECIFQHFHYFDAYGRLDEAEIHRSFEEAELLTSKNTVTIHHCTNRGNALYSSGFCEMAYELNNCLQKRIPKDYVKVFQLRDKITQQY